MARVTRMIGNIPVFSDDVDPQFMLIYTAATQLYVGPRARSKEDAVRLAREIFDETVRQLSEDSPIDATPQGLMRPTDEVEAIREDGA